MSGNVSLTSILPDVSSPPLVSTARVVDCYAVLDRTMVGAGLSDLTEGLYAGDPERPYEQAQAAQAAALVDRTLVAAGGRILDIGCGYGRILRECASRGILATGVTVSPQQARVDREAGLDVHLSDYRSLDHSWTGRFDGLVANGSLEHFAQTADAVSGQDDQVYRGFFAVAHRLLGKRDGRLVTTAIHFVDRPDPRDLLRDPLTFPAHTAARHLANLQHTFGGWYPTLGQLERCAAGQFEMIDEEDGTEDYRLTSEYWIQASKRALLTVDGVRMWWRLAASALWYPSALRQVLRCAFVDESWNWQFRGAPPPTRLLRQTWRRR